MKAGALTELEGCTLGLIWVMGPCTIYAVRKVLEGSPSAYWSGSAGTVYPLVRRLAARGLVQPKEAFRGKRRHINYVITQEGLMQFRAWFGPPLADYVTAIPADPLRTRVRFFGALDLSTRTEIIDVACASLKSEIEIARHKHTVAKAGQDPFKALMLRGVELMAQARLAWLDEVRVHLD